MSTPTGFNGQVLKVRGTEESREVEENDVVSGGEIIGSDPDENVRLEMLKRDGSGDAGGSDAAGG